MALDFVDRYLSTLSASYTSGGTTLSVTSAAGLPSGASDYYLIVLAEGTNTEEVFHVTSRSGSNLTVAGAQAGSVASDHANGAVILGSFMTKVAFTQFQADTVAKGGMVLLEQHTANNSATLDFTSCITSAYDDYLIEFVNLLPASGTNYCLMRFSTDGGLNFDANNNYEYALAYVYTAAEAIGGTSASDTKIVVCGSNWASGTLGAIGSVRLIDPLNPSLHKGAVIDIAYYHDSVNGVLRVYGFGRYKSNSAVNAFRILASSGNLASGTVRCYGLAK